MLLFRDPWLTSQTLMQILYLLPPWLLLWRSLEHGGAVLVLLPVLTMAGGQLAGGLAWLAISGEDAPDLVMTAPVPTRAIVSAKIEAVLAGVAIVFLPLVAVLAFLVPFHALIAALGNYGPRLLGVYATPQGPCSEPLEFLSALYNGEMRPVLLPRQDLGAYLPYRRVSFGQETVELGPAGTSPRNSRRRIAHPPAVRGPRRSRVSKIWKKGK